jgi:hypothetical protein
MLQPMPQTMQELSVAEVFQVAGGLLRRPANRLVPVSPSSPPKVG